MEYRRTRPLAHDAAGASSSSSSRRLFDRSMYVKLFSPINSISFSPTSFAITSATRAQIFHSRSGKPNKTLSRFNDVVRSANFRADGKLLVTGDDTGLAQVFDAQSRTTLRQFKGHSLPVYCAQFNAHTPTEIVTASDDRTVRLWDMPQESETRQYVGHEDYVRSASTSHDNAHLTLSGSYDGTVRLWDSRMAEGDGCAMVMKHGAPVEDVTFFSSTSSTALSVGGPVLRSWDLMMGGKCRTAVSNHSKTITSVTTNDDDKVFSAGLDQLVKVYDAANNFKVTHTMRYSAPILSCAISSDGVQLLVGMTDGTLCIQRQSAEAFKSQRKQISGEKGATAQRSDTEMGVSAVAVDTEQNRRRTANRGMPSRMPAKLKTHDRLLKSFRYRDALDYVLRKGVQPDVTFGVLDELRNRSTINKHGVVVLDGLRRAIEGRDDVTLEPLMRFLLRHAGNARWTSVVCDTLDVVMDVYADVLGQSPVIDEVFGKVWTKVSGELDVQRQIVGVRGALEMILVRSSMPAGDRIVSL